jgi:hypothetical protein
MHLPLQNGHAYDGMPYRPFIPDVVGVSDHRPQRVRDLLKHRTRPAGPAPVAGDDL